MAFTIRFASLETEGQKVVLSSHQAEQSCAISSSNCGPGVFLDPGSCNLQRLGEGLRGDDGRAALPHLGLHLISDLRGKL